MDDLILRSIRDAFPDGSPPQRPVTGHRCLECDRVDVLLGGRTWSDVAADFPDYCHDTFALLTPESQIYYLPAYMTVALMPECQGIQGISLESAFSSELRKEAFSDTQCRVIVAWLKEYWRRECPYKKIPPRITKHWGDLDL